MQSTPPPACSVSPEASDQLDSATISALSLLTALVSARRHSPGVELRAVLADLNSAIAAADDRPPVLVR